MREGGRKGGRQGRRQGGREGGRERACVNLQAGSQFANDLSPPSS